MEYVIEGYASVFYNERDSGTQYRIGQDAVERIMPGAFDRALRSSSNVVALWNHSMDWLLGSRAARTLHLSVDARGLKYRIDVNPDDPQHVTVFQKLLRGDVSGSSFSFFGPTQNVRREGGMFIREVVDLKLIEVSPVWMPAYPSTTSTARGASVRETNSKSPIIRRLREIERTEAQAIADRLAYIEANQ